MNLRRFALRWLSLFRQRRLDGDLDAEIRAHLEFAEQDAIASGRSVEEARHEASRNFGGILQMREDHRDRRSFQWMDTLLKDLRYGLASLVRDPGFSAVAIAVLALGIGANTAMFSLVDAVFLKPLPFPEPDRMVRVWEAPTAEKRNQTTTLTFLDWKHLTNIFEDLSVEFPTNPTLVLAGEPVRFPGNLVSADYFQVFGVKPLIGRTFVKGEDQPGSAPVVVLSHSAWQTRFGGDPDILSRKVLLDGEPHSVIGVLPPGAFDRDAAGFWKPLVFQPEQMIRGAHWLSVLGRLRPGVSLAQARTAMLALRASLAPVMPAWKKDWSFAVDPYAGVDCAACRPLVNETLRQSLYVAFGAVLMVLFIACANVANLLLAKGAARHKEMAVRAALGASRGRLVCQLLTESLVLCIFGGAAGLALAYILIRAALPLVAESLPFTADVRLDPRVLGFAALIAVSVSLFIGLLPSLQTPFSRLTQSLHQSARGSSGSHALLRRLIVAGEVAVSLVLISGAALMFKSLVNLQQVDAGVRIENIMTMSLDLSEESYPTSQSAVRFYEAVIQQVRAVPGVEQASLSQDLPLEGVRGGELMGLPGSAEPLVVRFKRVDPRYLSTLDIPLLSGRGISDRDRDGAPRVMVINHELAEFLARQYAMGNVVGKTVRLSTPGYGKKNGTYGNVEIVGVIRNEHVGDLNRPDELVVYVPLAQVPRSDVKLVVRTRGEPAAAMTGIREAVRQVDRNMPLADVRTMEQVKQRNLSGVRQPTWIIGAFAGIAALLAALGLYGVLSHAVTQQRREIGIRMALGAHSANVLSHVVGNALAMVAVGLVAGLAGVYALTRLMKSLLFGVSALDPVVLVIACLVMTIIGLLAALIPASRAARVDPMSALRIEG